MKRAEVKLSEFGEIAERVLQEYSARYGFILDTYVIMPNHIHAILLKQNKTAISVGQFVGAFKSLVSTQWYKICDQRGIVAGKLWQRNYFDHILRNDADHMEKLRYIDENPDKWQMDKLFKL